MDTMYIVSAGMSSKLAEQESPLWGLDRDHLAVQAYVALPAQEAPPPPAGSGVPTASGESKREAREIVAAKPASEAREEPDLSKLLQETSAVLIEQQVKRQELRDLEAAEMARATVAAQPQSCFDAGSAGLSEQQQQQQLKKEEEEEEKQRPKSLVDVPPQLPPQQQQQQQQLLPPQRPPQQQQQQQEQLLPPLPPLSSSLLQSTHQLEQLHLEWLQMEQNQLRLIEAQQKRAEELAQRQQEERLRILQEKEEALQEARRQQEARPQQDPPRQQDQEAPTVEEEEEADWGRDTSPSSSDSEADPAEPEADPKPTGESGFRRSGLPTRILVDRSGDMFMSVEFGQQEQLIDMVARVLDLRKEVIRSPSRASTPAVRRKGAITVLCREAQMKVWNKLFEEWRESEGSVRGKGSTEAQRLRSAKGYYKMHCYRTFGGMRWLKFLIAVGDVGPAAVNATNSLVRDRVREKRGQAVGLDPRKPDDDRRWVSRDLRPSPCFEAGAPKPKELRQEARRKAKNLALEKARRTDREQTPAEEAALVTQRDRVEELHRQARAVSKASG